MCNMNVQIGVIVLSALAYATPSNGDTAKGNDRCIDTLYNYALAIIFILLHWKIKMMVIQWSPKIVLIPEVFNSCLL